MMDREQVAPLGLAGKLPLVISAVFTMIGLFSMGLTLPQISSAYTSNSEAWLIPWIGSIPAPAFAITSPVIGHLMGRVDSKRIYLVSLLFFVIFGCAPLFLADLKCIVVMRVMLGASVAGIVMSAVYRIGRLPETQRATLFGLQEMSGSIAALFILPLVGLLLRYGWRAPFALHALGLLCVPFVLTLPPDGFDRSSLANSNKRSERQFLGGLSVTLCVFSAVVGSEVFLNTIVSPYYLISIGVQSPTTAAIPLTATVFSAMLGASFYGFLYRRTSTLAVFILGSVAVSVGLVVCGTSRTLTSFTIGAFLASAGLSNCIANICTAAVQCNSASPGQALGLVIGIMYLVPIGLPLVATFIERFSGPGGPFVLFGLASACSAVFFAFKPPPTLLKSYGDQDGVASSSMT